MKITFIGAGSTVFVRNIIGDCMLIPDIGTFDVALYDIDEKRLNDSCCILENMKKTLGSKANIKSYTDRIEALRGTDFVINAIQVGGYKPCTVTDFEVPNRYSLKQTMADTLGVGGIFRGLRTIPVMQGIAEDIEKVCPNAWLITYSNPMAILTGYMQRYTKVKTLGLCHSVQNCVRDLFLMLDIDIKDFSWKIAGINHMAWVLEVRDKDGKDLYPYIKKIALERPAPTNLVRLEMMHKFGYYVTESSEHNAEYLPYFIKSKYPELIERFNIPLDDYPKRCEAQIESWNKMRDSLINDAHLMHYRSDEYASYVIEGIAFNKPYKKPLIGGNVLNTGLITNLPSNACVEVPCYVDANGVTPTYVGALPPQLAALNMTNINVQLLSIEAAVTRKKEHIYHAALLDPHTSSELSIDDIIALCDDLIEAHGDWLPKFH